MKFLSDYRSLFLPEVNRELKTAIEFLSHESPDELGEMVRYHFGFLNPSGRSRQHGKRLRPLVLLLCAMAVGGDWRSALPAAAAIELIHNFSLIHDDIQDASQMRHGQETLWKKWGVSKAINAGDALFALAFLELEKIHEHNSSKIVDTAYAMLAKACIELTGGQSMDLIFEIRKKVSIDDYIKMAEGKTGALFSISARLGGLVGGASTDIQTKLAQFGRSLGLAFQMRDDWLGIWGEELKTGKSSSSDVETGKKTLPIIHAISVNPHLGEKLVKGVRSNEVGLFVSEISITGAGQFTLTQAKKYQDECRKILTECHFQNEGGIALRELLDEMEILEV